MLCEEREGDKHQILRIDAQIAWYIFVAFVCGNHRELPFSLHRYWLAQAQTSVWLQICRQAKCAVFFPFSIFIRWPWNNETCRISHSVFPRDDNDDILFRKNVHFMLAGGVRSKFAYDNEIVIQVSNNVLHQISSRVFGTLVEEILDYNVRYENVTSKYPVNPTQLSEKDKLYYTLKQIET